MFSPTSVESSAAIMRVRPCWCFHQQALNEEVSPCWCFHQQVFCWSPCWCFHQQALNEEVSPCWCFHQQVFCWSPCWCFHQQALNEEVVIENNLQCKINILLVKTPTRAEEWICRWVRLWRNSPGCSEKPTAVRRRRGLVAKDGKTAQ